MEQQTSTSKTEYRESGWKWTAIAALAVAIPSAIFSVVELWDRYNQSSGPKFSVTTASSGVFLPPKHLLEIMGVKNPDSLSRLRELNGLLVLTIKNAGDLDAQEVRIDANDSGFAMIAFDDQDSKPIEFTERFDIGVLQSDQSVRITIWGRENSFFDNGTPLILHSGGKVPIELSGSLSSYSWLFLIGIILGLVVWISQNLYNWYRLKVIQKQVDAALDGMGAKFNESFQEAFHSLRASIDVDLLEEYSTGRLTDTPETDSD